jgi:hypothetical protein
MSAFLPLCSFSSHVQCSPPFPRRHSPSRCSFPSCKLPHVPTFQPRAPSPSPLFLRSFQSSTIPLSNHTQYAITMSRTKKAARKAKTAEAEAAKKHCRSAAANGARVVPTVIPDPDVSHSNTRILLKCSCQSLTLLQQPSQGIAAANSAQAVPTVKPDPAVSHSSARISLQRACQSLT